MTISDWLLIWSTYISTTTAIHPAKSSPRFGLTPTTHLNAWNCWRNERTADPCWLGSRKQSLHLARCIVDNRGFVVALVEVSLLDGKTTYNMEEWANTNGGEGQKSGQNLLLPRKESFAKIASSSFIDQGWWQRSSLWRTMSTTLCVENTLLCESEVCCHFQDERWSTSFFS